jgi:hypothetical protein
LTFYENIKIYLRDPKKLSSVSPFKPLPSNTNEKSKVEVGVRAGELKKSGSPKRKSNKDKRI